MFYSQKPIHLTRNLMVTLFTNQESHTVRAKPRQTYFNQVVRECIRNLKNDNVAYCFNWEQLDEIKRKLKDKMIINSYFDDDCGCYFIRKVSVIK